MKRPGVILIVGGVLLVAVTAVAGYLAGQSQEGSRLQRRVTDYQRIAEDQLGMVRSLRQELDSALGDRLVVAGDVGSDLPETIEQAQAQGYVVMDELTIEGKTVVGRCELYQNALHYSKTGREVTGGAEGHGVPLTLIYNSLSGRLMGVVLESTSPQPSPLWKHYPEGHPGMEFPHWSLHFWFTTPPVNLSPAASGEQRPQS